VRRRVQRQAIKLKNFCYDDAQVRPSGGSGRFTRLRPLSFNTLAALPSMTPRDGRFTIRSLQA
jgi:hypothetical protein